MVGTIYKLTSPSGKSYIGQTMNISIRRRTFKNLNAYYSGKRMDNAIKKYGPEAFEFTILIQIYDQSRDELRRKLDELEVYYIEKYDTYRNGYNMTIGGSGTKGCFMTEESRQKIRLAALGRIGAMKGKHLSEKSRKMISDHAKTRTGCKNPFYGKSHSDNTKKRIGDANSKAVVQLDPCTNSVIAEFSSAKAAGVSLGNPRGNSEIIKVCRHYVSPRSKKRYLTALGYKWKYKESPTTIPKGSTSQANGDGNGGPQ